MGKDRNDDTPVPDRHSVEGDRATGKTPDQINPSDYANPFNEGGEDSDS